MIIQYFGGKAKIAKYIVSFLESHRKENQIYIEPFVGGANIVSKMTDKRYAYDLNEYLIEMYKGVQNGYELPDTLSEEQYQYIKNHKDEDKILTGFVGFGCSFAGKWFGGYARDHNGRNYCKNAKNSIIKQFPYIKDVIFECKDYKILNPHNCLIYCDPPYQGTTKYTGVPDFDSNEFWSIMRRWSIDNDVYISEYNAPNDFISVLTIPTKTDIRDTNNKNIKRIEKLFTRDSAKSPLL